MVIRVPAGTYVLDLGDGISAMNTAKIYLQCETAGGAINIVLPLISTAGNWWFTVYVNDVDNMAGTNPITVTVNPSDKIYGASSPIALSQNGASAVFEIVGNNAWTMNTTVSSYISSQYAGVYNVSSSSLTSLPPIPANAVNFNASGNSLTSMPILSASPLIKILNLSNNLITSIPSISDLTSLITLSLSNNKFVSFSNSLSGLTALSSIDLSTNSLLTSFTPSIIGLTSLTALRLRACALPTANVDAILADAVLAAPTITGAVTLTLQDGTNGAPSVQGTTDKNILVGTFGWTVTTN